MALRALAALVRKDLQLFFGDRRAVILSVAVPIAIASFFGSMFSGPGNDAEPARIPIAVVDRDGSSISKAIVAAMQKDRTLAISTPSMEGARAVVQKGATAAAVIIPAGFGSAAGRAFVARGAKPLIEILFDPSRAAEVGMVRGMITGHVMEAVGQEVFSGAQGRSLVDDTVGQLDAADMPAAQRDAIRNLLRSLQAVNGQPGTSGATAGVMTVPYDVKENAVVAGGANALYNGYAHSFAGMGIQFLLFTAIDLGMGILLERELGIWKRFRSAPLSRLTFLGARALSGTMLTLLVLLVSFLFAIVVFGVRIHGSVLGFAAIAVACSIMAATFGLLVAALGKTAAATRRVATFAVLIMVMLGGAWVPSFIFPAWLQRITVVIPARWAVDGLDAMTWRGLGFGAAITPTLVLLGFAVAFGALTLARFRWEEA
ncbi:MAG TPA: ABC transporter permease [Vicinamibacterales bacterium]|nr:ABC transporter permease [Vicinamibacterales bacterium]